MRFSRIHVSWDSGQIVWFGSDFFVYVSVVVFEIQFGINFNSYKPCITCVLYLYCNYVLHTFSLVDNKLWHLSSLAFIWLSLNQWNDKSDALSNILWSSYPSLHRHELAWTSYSYSRTTYKRIQLSHFPIPINHGTPVWHS